MCDNEAINNLTGISPYAGYYWQEANISSKDLANTIVYTGDLNYMQSNYMQSNWNYGITLNEDAVKEIVEKIIKEREFVKITLNDGPEIPKWTGFLDI